MLTVRLLTFALGGATAAMLRMKLGLSMPWSIAIGAVVYVAVDVAAERFLFGHVGWRYGGDSAIMNFVLVRVPVNFKVRTHVVFAWLAEFVPVRGGPISGLNGR
jgi:hypothetical protein